MLGQHGGHQTVVKSLIAAGATMEAPDSNGWTPLLVACERGHQEVVERLLQVDQHR